MKDKLRELPSVDEILKSPEGEGWLERVMTETLDGEYRTIPAFYYKPRGGGRFPVIISIHGTLHPPQQHT